ncbi:MAG: hypothetical protein K9G67_14570 [Bacteroidales bacterium]|nr:hypothetical protein [Bacteroidales bacterium]MCF8351275.1 hypothetical protein [Bacteroidales bacterium]MCF8377576.1 hypothetical protein [Bacteroidales bacterium]MCF8401843.1 hypothetical protein [Bacteroidales bacterium]
MKRRLLTLFIASVFISITTLSAQESSQDVITLKNGIVVEGKIIRNAPGKYYIFEKENGERLTIYVVDIEKIEYGKTTDTTGKRFMGSPLKKFNTFLEVGAMLLTSDENFEGEPVTKDAFLSAYFTNSFLLPRDFTIGLGIGVEDFPGSTMVPIYLDFRKYLGNDRLRTAIIFDGGYGFGSHKPNTSIDWAGFFIEPAIGLMLRNDQFVNLLFRLGYKRQHFKIGGVSNTRSATADFLTIRLGIHF